jgi:hypothetical protein
LQVVVATVLEAQRVQEYFDGQGFLVSVLVAVAALARAVAVAALARAVFEEDFVSSYFAFFRHIKFFRR